MVRVLGREVLRREYAVKGDTMSAAIAFHGVYKGRDWSVINQYIYTFYSCMERVDM